MRCFFKDDTFACKLINIISIIFFYILVRQFKVEVDPRNLRVGVHFAQVSCIFYTVFIINKYKNHFMT